LAKSHPARVFARPVFARLRRICLALPDAVEGWSWNHPVFRVGTKSFCAFEVVKGRPSVAFRVTVASARQFARKPHFFATPFGRSVWISRWVDVAVDPESLGPHIAISYRLVAPKRLLRDLGETSARRGPARR
jgi:predicted DNA-binding protein (MmcQ/YjbR family)